MLSKSRRSLNHRRVFCFLAALVVFTLPVRAQEPSRQQREEDLHASHEDIERFIAILRPVLFGNLSGNEAEIYKQIQFRVTDLDYPSRAGSLIEDGTRIVEIDEGYGREIEMMAEALLIEGAQNRPVLIPYIRYVVVSWRNKSSFVKDPTSFAHFDPDDIDDKQLNEMTVSGLAFVLAHEVGHHVLHHYDHSLPSNPEKLRQMEQDADAWALNRCVHAKPHVSPLGGMLPLLFDYYTTPAPISRETHSDHPANLRRITLMFTAMEAALPQYRDDIEREGASYDEFRSFIIRSLDSYEEQIRTDAPPVRAFGDP
jgi:hypothetical protein